MIATFATRRVATGLAWLVALGMVMFLAYALVRQAEEPVTSLKMDRPAPNFSLTTFSGETISSESLKGRPVVINFWASWCVPCRDEAQVLERAWNEFRDQGVVFVGVNIQDTEPAARAFLTEFGHTYPNGRDLDGEIAIEYGVARVPETFFVDRNGRIVVKYMGPLNESALRSNLEEILQ